MTRLQIYRGPDANFARPADETRGPGRRFSTNPRFSDEGEPAVLSLVDFVTRGSRRPDTAPLSRAKALHANRTCRFCGHPQVAPVTLADGQRDGSGEYVPGSATLVGFHCDRCDAEWPVLGE